MYDELEYGINLSFNTWKYEYDLGEICCESLYDHDKCNKVQN